MPLLHLTISGELGEPLDPSLDTAQPQLHHQLGAAASSSPDAALTPTRA